MVSKIERQGILYLDPATLPNLKYCKCFQDCRCGLLSFILTNFTLLQYHNKIFKLLKLKCLAHYIASNNKELFIMIMKLKFECPAWKECGTKLSLWRKPICIYCVLIKLCLQYFKIYWKVTDLNEWRVEINFVLNTVW